MTTGVSWCLVGLRLALACSLLLNGSVGGWVFGLSGLLAVVSTVGAWWVGQPDRSWLGAGVGLGYLAVLLLRPGQGSDWGAVAFGVVFVAQVWVRVVLWHRCTVSAPVFVSVVEDGPYGWVRHPLSVTELLLVVLCMVETPSVWNLVVGPFVLLVKVFVVRWEEKFLMRFRPYREYAGRVKWRWCPGVW